jgi:hypothetical protein
MCQFVDQHPQVGFVLGEPTIIDFFFFESCQYAQGLFGQPHRIEKWLDKEESKRKGLKPSIYYVEIMAKYLEFMKSQEWYIKNRQYLESFSILCKMMPPERVQGIRALWMGNPQYVA